MRLVKYWGVAQQEGPRALTPCVGQVRTLPPQPCAHRRHLQTNIDPLTATIYYWKKEFDCKSNYIPVAPYGETSERRGNGNRYSFMGLVFLWRGSEVANTWRCNRLTVRSNRTRASIPIPLQLNRLEPATYNCEALTRYMVVRIHPGGPTKFIPKGGEHNAQGYYSLFQRNVARPFENA